MLQTKFNDNKILQAIVCTVWTIMSPFCTEKKNPLDFTFFLILCCNTKNSVTAIQQQKRNPPIQLYTLMSRQNTWSIDIAIQNLSKLAKHGKTPNAERESIHTNSSLVHVRSISISPETIFNINIRSVFSSKLYSPFSVFYSPEFETILRSSVLGHRKLTKQEMHRSTILQSNSHTFLRWRKTQTVHQFCSPENTAFLHRFRLPKNAEPVSETRMEEKCKIANWISVSLPCNDLILVWFSFHKSHQQRTQDDHGNKKRTRISQPICTLTVLRSNSFFVFRFSVSHQTQLTRFQNHSKKMIGLKTHMNVNKGATDFVKFWKQKQIQNCYSHHRSNQISQTDSKYCSHLQNFFLNHKQFSENFREFSKISFEKEDNGNLTLKKTAKDLLVIYELKNENQKQSRDLLYKERKKKGKIERRKTQEKK